MDNSKKDDPFGWSTPRPPQQRVNPNALFGGPIGSFEEYESVDIQEPSEEIKITQETVKSFDAQGSISFKETIIQQTVKPEAIQLAIPDVGEKLVKATEITGKAAEDVAEAGWDLFKMILGIEKRPKKSAGKEDPKKTAGQQVRQQAMNETARRVTETARERQTKNSLEEYRKQVNKVLGITSSFEGTMDDNGQLRTDIKINYEKAQAKQQEDAEKAKKESQMAALKSKGKPGTGPDLRQNTMTEKTAGGSALTTVG